MKYWGRPPVEQQIAETILGAISIAATLVIYPADRISAWLVGEKSGTLLFRKRDFNRETKRLQKRGYVALTKTNKGWLLKITRKGKRALKKIKLKSLKLPRPKVWDGRWRLFVFDIPEKHAYSRDAIRRKLKSLGMYNFQRSVLAYPHDCREELEQVADYYMLDEYYTYVETNYVDIDKELRRHFHL